jgi:hypothetical protein
VLSSWLINYGIDTQVNVGNNGSLANVHGQINLSNSNGHYGLAINDNVGSGSRPWSIGYEQTVVGDLTLNYAGVNAPAPYLDIFSRYQAFPQASSNVTLAGDPRFYIREFNAAGFPTFQVDGPGALFNRDGEAVAVSFSASGGPGGPITYGASNLPPGLSIDPITGGIGGTIQANAYLAGPYQTKISASQGQLTRVRDVTWYVESAITIDVPIPGFLLSREGTAQSLGPITTTNSFNRAVTLAVTGLPPGVSFNPDNATISGVIGVGSAQDGPYRVTVQATDGFETAAFAFDWNVTGITFNVPAIQNNFIGATVSVPMQASAASGASLNYSAEGLPTGLSINPSSGLITGVVGAAAARINYVTVTATHGVDVATVNFTWAVLPAGVSNYVTVLNPGAQTSHEGEFLSFGLSGSSSLGLPLSFTVTGLPPGLTVGTGEGFYIGGQIAPGAGAASPYHVVITATDGVWSDEVAFDWFVSPSGTVDFYYAGTNFSLVNESISFQMYAVSSLNEPLTYSAAGLPSGLSIDPQTGLISGVVAPLASLPGIFQVSVTATSASDSDTTTFLWNVLSGYDLNVVSLPHPSGTGFFNVVSPLGTQLTASIATQAGVATPSGIQFPFGFLTFTVSGLQPGAAADVTIVGLDLETITDYYRYGATPANTSNHWYNFLYNEQTDGDSAVGTGMEILGSSLVLHLIDGGRGDDDLAMNGVIFDIGGPAKEPSPRPGDYDGDADVDGNDFLTWQRQLGASSIPAGSGADGNANGVVDGGDLPLWGTHFGSTGNAAASLTALADSRQASSPAIGAWGIPMLLADGITLWPDVNDPPSGARSRYFDDLQDLSPFAAPSKDRELIGSIEHDTQLRQVSSLWHSDRDLEAESNCAGAESSLDPSLTDSYFSEIGQDLLAKGR